MREWIRKAALAFMLLAIAAPSAFAEGKEFRLGVISDKPVGRINQYGPMASYVAKRLEAFGITRGKVVIARNVDAMLEKVRKGEVDVVLESAFPTMEMKEKEGLVPGLLVWKKGSREYSSVFFVRKESSIAELSDLKGKTIVFEDPQSTSAYLLPRAELERNGLTVLPSDEQKGTSGAVRFVFGGEETNQAFFVLKNRADAGAFSSDDWRELPVGMKSELKVIHETKPVLRFVASFHPGLPTELREALSVILTQMDRDPEGLKILRGGARIEKMENLSGRDYRSLEYVQEIMKALGE